MACTSGRTGRPWSPPAVDFALALPEVDADRIVLVGMSLGGYPAARAAAFEHRVAACVLYDGVYDFHSTVEPVIRFHQRTFGWLNTVLHLSTIGS